MRGWKTDTRMTNHSKLTTVYTLEMSQNMKVNAKKKTKQNKTVVLSACHISTFWLYNITENLHCPVQYFNALNKHNTHIFTHIFYIHMFLTKRKTYIFFLHLFLSHTNGSSTSVLLNSCFQNCHRDVNCGKWKQKTIAEKTVQLSGQANYSWSRPCPTSWNYVH